MLVETKLRIPRRRGVVGRERLGERLRRGDKLTVVSGPAGFGKTTLVAEWAAESGCSVAWVSLDRRDNDPALFWAYLLAALRIAEPGVGDGALSLLESGKPPIEAVLATLINDLDALPNEIVVVLDDYHVIEARDVQEGMAFLVDNLPPQVRLVIAARADPGLPLARLRARGELVEIRAADLRFRPDEAAAYLNGVMGLGLTARDVEALEGRTEGWIAALQLAALSMQGRDDAGAFIAGFAGDDRYVVDYLVEEVLQRQPEDVRRFLLQTSILERLTGPLCDAVTGEPGGKVMLVALERGNLFLVPLDDRRQWYRYHQLFADVLRAHLLDEQPDEVPELHRRASTWYEGNGEHAVAIDHALAAKDFEHAAELVERATPAMLKDRREGALLSWLEALPDEVIKVRPVLTVRYAGTLLSTNKTEGVESLLRAAERWLESANKTTEATSAEEVRRLPGWIAVYRAGLALMLGNPAATVTHAQRALELLDPDDLLGQGAASALIGLASWGSGDLETAHEAYTATTASLHKAGYIADVLGCSITLADIRIVQGRLGDAMRTYERALRLASEQDGAPPRGTPDMYVGISALHREHGDLEAATQYLVRSQELGEHLGLPQNRYRWRVAMARIREAEGDLDAAVDLYDEAERLYVGDFSPDVRPVPAMRARVWIAQDRLSDVSSWVSERGLSSEDELSYLQEFEHVTLARALLAQDESDEARRLLERLLQSADEGGRSTIEILVLQALAQQLRGDVPAALVTLERALALAEPEGYCRIFVDEGAPMATLLKAAHQTEYVVRLLTAFDKTGRHRTTARQGLIEPLSDRELDVLRLLGTDLDGPDIARELIVSLNTVRTHTQHIYAKLGVNNRRAAVRRAEELDLLTHHR
ncbi:LuxR family maltose regulon positive regulatory protein [Kribbella orskensis]|uniref:LuxR family maltose regulon positive regulatory protein n=1 Tax=Kribbella orskensis TaxID=2512216 RepID=A0ABY2B757_9ACTN|nr:LuxR family maltose regulon positive regulatory protein [Kribbella sp. VKM Ac-2500]TCO10061.1 LuxR family maltose regulon positive regulatory protein [Kribbella orskensis]